VKSIIAGVEIFANGISWRGWKPGRSHRNMNPLDLIDPYQFFNHDPDRYKKINHGIKKKWSTYTLKIFHGETWLMPSF